jgi:hypothetical protein
MGVLKAFMKYSVERKKYVLDYTCWLETDEALSDFAIRVSPATTDLPLVVSGAYVDPTETKVAAFISGGKPGVIYEVDFIAQTNIGQTKADTLQIRIV